MAEAISEPRLMEKVAVTTSAAQHSSGHGDEWSLNLNVHGIDATYYYQSTPLKSFA
jgi:hypothetical protein